jgi:hypothetical protein
MDELKNLLAKRMVDHKLGDEAIASLVCHNANLIADGKYIANRYKNGILTVVVANSAQANNLHLELWQIKKRVAERVNPYPINKVIIKVNSEQKNAK